MSELIGQPISRQQGWELEQQFWQEVIQLEEDRRMPYITSVERIGIQKGRVQGMREGLLKGIELGLRLKFGSEGSRILPEISELQDVNLLEAIVSGLETVSTLDELRLLYQHST